MKPLTDTIPKPMIAIRGKPFLQYQLELFRKHGIREVILCVGYLQEAITGYFGDGSAFGLQIAYSIEDGFRGTGGALQLAERLLPESFIVAYGDSYLPIDYTALAHFWLSCEAMGLVVCYDNDPRIAENNVSIDADGRIREYNKRRTSAGMNYVEAGVMILKKDVLKMIPAGGNSSLEEDIFPALIERGELLGYPTSERYFDIGTPERIRCAEGAL